MNYRLGLDGGGTKTEAILIDAEGTVVGRATGPGCNPSIVGADTAKRIVAELVREALAPFPTAADDFKLEQTLLCMAGNRAFWQEFASSLTTFGKVTACDDSVPVLELATGGKPGLVLHAGTGSFVAARGSEGAEVFYAGGLGWRFGDAGSGYDIARRAIARALLELQGWFPASGLSPFVQEQTGIADGQAISRFFYNDSTANPKISQLAPGVLDLAANGDAAAEAVVRGSTTELVELARAMAEKLFGPIGRGAPLIDAGLSGRILNHPFVAAEITQATGFAWRQIVEPPIEGVRRLLLRGN